MVERTPDIDVRGFALTVGEGGQRWIPSNREGQVQVPVQVQAGADSSCRCTSVVPSTAVGQGLVMSRRIGFAPIWVRVLVCVDRWSAWPHAML